jgi:hypothetical protein
VSTGAGPFTYYTSGGSGRRQAYAVGPTVARLSNAEKADEARLALQRLDAVHALHRQDFPPLERQVAGLAALPELRDLVKEERRKALAGIGLLSWGLRRRAKERAQAEAEAASRRLHAEAVQRQEAEQTRLDDLWRRINDNEESVVLPLLEAAFDDNEAPVAAVGADGRDVAIAVLVPGEEALPERCPGVTAHGNVSLRRATRTQLAGWDRQLVAGHVLLSAKETLATAPGATSVTVVAVRRSGDAFVPVLAVCLDRDRVAAAPFATADAWSILVREGRDLLFSAKGAAQVLQPLEIDGQPDLADLAAAFD